MLCHCCCSVGEGVGRGRDAVGWLVGYHFYGGVGVVFSVLSTENVCMKYTVKRIDRFALKI